MREWMNEPYDVRPVIAKCDCCGRSIYGSDYTHYGDSFYEIEDAYICEDCLKEWCDEHYRKGD